MYIWYVAECMSISPVLLLSVGLLTKLGTYISIYVRMRGLRCVLCVHVDCVPLSPPGCHEVHHVVMLTLPYWCVLGLLSWIRK